MEFYLIIWKQFVNCRMISKSEIVYVDNATEAMLKIKSINAQKRLTTTDYDYINLTERFAAQKITLHHEEVQEAISLEENAKQVPEDEGDEQVD